MLPPTASPARTALPAAVLIATNYRVMAVEADASEDLIAPFQRAGLIVTRA